jgi:cobaltochelatase CobN
MHLLKTNPGGYADDAGITRIEQSPADIIILSAADTDIALLAEGFSRQPADYPGLRLANLLHLRNHASVDLYVDEVLQHGRLIVAVILGGGGVSDQV